MLSASSFALAFASLAGTVSAHGWVHSITLDGVTYQGADPYGSAISSPIRQVSSNSPASPVYGDINGAAMTCGGDAKPAALTVPVTAGSDVSINWASWPHNVGPIITYLGACDGDCSSTDPSKVNFFKIDEVDFLPGTTTWVQSQTLYKGLPYNFTLPEDIPSGNFIMRHEVIALHNAMNPGGAEFFPQCIQITVDCGSGVTPNDTVRFPGGYSASDPGILLDVYTDLTSYIFPGPLISLALDVSLDDDDDSGTTTLSSSSTKTVTVTSTSTSTKYSTTTTKASTTKTSTTSKKSSTSTSKTTSKASTTTSKSSTSKTSSLSTSSTSSSSSTSATSSTSTSSSSSASASSSASSASSSTSSSPSSTPSSTSIATSTSSSSGTTTSTSSGSSSTSADTSSTSSTTTTATSSATTTTTSEASSSTTSTTTSSSVSSTSTSDTSSNAATTSNSASSTSSTDSTSSTPTSSSTSTRTRTWTRHHSHDHPTTTSTSTTDSTTPTTTSSSDSATSTSAQSTTTSSSQSSTETIISVDLQNGRDAISLNLLYSTRSAGSPCTGWEIGCLGDDFGQCVWGTWVGTKCPTGLVCAALPNIGVLGTSIACTWASDRDARIAATGANLRLKRHRRRSPHFNNL